MNTNKRLATSVALAALFLLGLAGSGQAQEKEPPAEGCKLFETKSFTEDEKKDAENYANSYSGDTGAEVDGVPLVYRSTVRVLKASKTHRVIVVKIWVCPKPAAAAGINGDPVNLPVIKPVKPVKPDCPKPGPDVPTYDPREDHSNCEKPARFECGQHYLWWLRNHDHKPKKTEKKADGSKTGRDTKSGSVAPIEIVPLPLTGDGSQRPSVPTYDPRTHEYRGGVLVPKPAVTPGANSGLDTTQQEIQRMLELQRLLQIQQAAQDQAAQAAVRSMRS